MEVMVLFSRCSDWSSYASAYFFAVSREVFPIHNTSRAIEGCFVSDDMIVSANQEAI